MPHASQPPLLSPQSSQSCCWRVPGVLVASNVLVQDVSNTAYPLQHKTPTSDRVLTVVLIASTVWEVSLYPNRNRSHSDLLSQASSTPSSAVPQVCPCLRRTALRVSIRRMSPFSPPVCSLLISVERTNSLGVTVDGRKKLGRLGVWWTCQNSNAVEAPVGVRTEGVGAEHLVLDVVWKGMLLPISLTHARWQSR